MRIINYKINEPKDAVLVNLKDNARVVQEEKFDLSRGKPRMHFKEKGDVMKIKCEMVEGPSRDNGFLEGTYFLGRITEREGTTRIRGVILTAPVYHLLFLALFIFFVVRCISLGAVSPIPIILLIFDGFMFYGEFKKQSVIKRYVFRALKITYNDSRAREQRERRRAERESRAEDNAEA